MKDKSSVDFDAEAEVQPLTGTQDVKLDIDSPPASFWRKHSRWIDVQNPLLRKAVVNLTLILIWYEGHIAVDWRNRTSLLGRLECYSSCRPSCPQVLLQHSPECLELYFAGQRAWSVQHGSLPR